MAPGASKYGNKITEVEGIKFRSKREAKRFVELRLLQSAGEIRNLVLQPRYPLIVNGVKVCTYVADFSFQRRDGASVVEDVKGARTLLYKVKKALMKAVHGIEIVEV